MKGATGICICNKITIAIAAAATAAAEYGTQGDGLLCSHCCYCMESLPLFVLGSLLAINKVSLASSHPVAMLTHASYRRSHLHQDEESTKERLNLII